MVRFSQMVRSEGSITIAKHAVVGSKKPITFSISSLAKASGFGGIAPLRWSRFCRSTNSGGTRHWIYSSQRAEFDNERKSNFLTWAELGLRTG